MLFKVKKTLLPCLLAVGNHIKYDSWLKHVFETFKTFSVDQIWGVRKVCLEVLPQLMNKMKPTETDRIAFCLNFLSSCLEDESKWVRNKAYEQFGPILYAAYQKNNTDAAIKTKIRQVSDAFY